MTLVDDRTRHTPQADAEYWLPAFEAGPRTLVRRDSLHLEPADHGRPGGARGAAAPDDCPHAGLELPYSAAADAAAPGNAAFTNLMESGTNGAATINGSSRQNLGTLGLVL